MTGEQIFGVIIMTLCSFGSGALFYGIGIWAQKRKDPMHFWSGTEVEPGTISDIPAYNRENARMWKLYSVPFWLAGLASIGSIFEERVGMLSLVFLVLGSTAGIGWLVMNYNKICKRYRK